MAAAPSKPSPSNRSMEATNEASASAAAKEATASDPESPAPEPEPAPAPAMVETPPTYLSVETSDFFLSAKSSLNDGKFEEAMSIIEEGIQLTRDQLKRTTDLTEEEISVHQSMAPLHYYYGTTLLYSIEETDQEVTTAGSAVSTAVVSGEEEVAAESSPPEEVPEPEENPVASAADVDEDLQIAWENLEAARQIMENMMTRPQSNSEKLELDLAQVFLREGDLQRINGRNEAAIQDYQSCLRLRKKSAFLDKYDRKIADVHYNLGLVYINVASKDEESNSSEEETQKVMTVKDEMIKEAKRVMARNKSIYHFLECSKCFCGQIASICNADADNIITTAEGGLVNKTSQDDSSPKYKITGEEDKEMELPHIASAMLSTMRKRIVQLVSASNLTTDQRADVEDLCQLLEDIQETVDEAENSTRGVQEVTSMKAEVAAMAAADGEPGETMEGTATTTIGFGAATTFLGFGEATSTGLASASGNPTESASSAAQPMMLIKRKMKRSAVETIQEPNSKMPMLEDL